MSRNGTPSSGTSRRAVLAAGAAATLGATGGCVKRARNVMARDPASQVSVQVLTAPADSNPFAVKIANELASNLRACGVDANVTPMSPEALYRQVLLDHDFDVYVGQFHQADWFDPDQLYSLLHSVYAGEPGWQNPFGYTDLGLDDHLENQRAASGQQRRQAIEDVQQSIVEAQPFTTVALPDSLATVRTDRFRDWRVSPTEPLTLLALRPAEGVDPTALRLATTDGRITENRNPLAAEFRTHGTVIDLIYDPVGRPVGGVTDPWLAADWQFSDDGADLVAEVTLREGLAWHDGEALTADDVAFTYRFLADTSLGEADSPIPASRYRGCTSLVDEATAVSDETVRVEFVDASRNVAERAFTVPVLPEHVWTERTDTAKIAGVETNRTMTDALAWNNPDPVGSGPFQFERAVADDSLRLSRFDDHFLNDGGDDVRPWLANAPAYDEIRLQATGSDDSAVELVASGEADATVSPLGPGVVPRIGRNPSLNLVSVPSRAFYHVGYNTRQAPLSNTLFRRVVSRLLDEAYLVQSVFDGYARPVASPLDGTGWLPSEMEWDSDDPAAPFYGSDGDLDATAAKRAFVEAGYRYDNGQLLSE